MKETEQKVVRFTQRSAISRNGLMKLSIGKRVAIPKATYLKSINFFCYLNLVRRWIRFIVAIMR